MLKFGMNKCHNLLFQAFISEFDYVDLFMIYVVIFCLIWKNHTVWFSETDDYSWFRYSIMTKLLNENKKKKGRKERKKDRVTKNDKKKKTTVWFFSNETKDDDINPKRINIIKFWKNAWKSRFWHLFMPNFSIRSQVV